MQNYEILSQWKKTKRKKQHIYYILQIGKLSNTKISTKILIKEKQKYINDIKH